MQGHQPSKKKFKGFNELITKIGRLRRKLLSYGWSFQEITTIILFEFLKLPKIDWKELKSTTSYYQTKERLKIDSGTAQLVMCLQQIVPNLHAGDVCQYLLNVLLYNSLEFGFNLDDSSSDSNESSSILHQKCKYRPKHRLKKKKSQKRLQNKGTYERQKKKVKKQEDKQAKQAKQESLDHQTERQERYQEILKMREPSYCSFEPSQEEMEKKLRKEESDCE